MNSMSFLPLMLVLCMCIGSLYAFQSPAYVNVGACLPFAIVAGATVTNDGPSVVTGDLALTPGVSVTGFAPGRIVGSQHIIDAAASSCMGDLVTAINDANGRAPDVTLGGELGGMTLTPGVYKSDATFAITGTLYLDGRNDPNAAWIFIMATSLTVNTGSAVVMLNYDNTHGTNVWWSAGSRADIFTTAKMQGTVMAHQSISAQGGATTGPLMANIGQVALISNVVNSYSHYTNATVPVMYTPAPTPSPPSSAESTSRDSSTLSNGAIAGIVVGGFVLLAVLAIAIWFFAFGAASAGYAGPKATTVSLDV